jgi:hypothetical protein
MAIGWFKVLPPLGSDLHLGREFVETALSQDATAVSPEENMYQWDL